MSLDPAIATAINAALNKAIATALKYDPGTRMSLRTLQGKVLHICCTSPAVSVYALIEDGEVRLSSHHEHEAHCTLTGRASDLLSLLWQDNHSLADSGVTVSGEPGLLGNVQQLLRSLDLDWQQAIADVVGDTAAFPINRALSAQGQWLRQRGERLPDWIADMLTEELRLMPSKDELEIFFDEVNQLRADSERLEARLDKLRSARKMSKGSGQ